MSASATLLSRIPGINPARLLQPQAKACLRNTTSKRTTQLAATPNALSLRGTTQARTLTTTGTTAAGSGSASEGHTVVKPAARLEELNRLGLTPYPRYLAPKVPTVLVRDLIQEYDHRLENGTKDETKKVSICGKCSFKSNEVFQYFRIGAKIGYNMCMEYRKLMKDNTTANHRTNPL